MNGFLASLILTYGLAFGVVIGGSLLSGMAALLVLQSPTERMLTIANHIKIWAVVIAIGGTIDPIRYIENQVAEGHIDTVMKQIILILVAFVGAHTATAIIGCICKGTESS